MHRKALAISAAAVLASSFSSCSSERTRETEPAASPAALEVGAHENFKPSAAAIAKGRTPTPPEGAQQATMIGEEAVMVMTDDATDDSFWSEEIDVDGDGTVEESDVLYDDEDGVLYIYSEADFDCAEGGGRGSGSLLAAVYSEGNPRGKPAGSGWYAVELDEGECNARAAALWGCRFDENGVRTDCGIVTVEDEEDDIAIVEATS